MSERWSGISNCSETVASIAHVVREHDAGAVAIIDDGHVVGVVTIRHIANIERLLDRFDTEAGP